MSRRDLGQLWSFEVDWALTLDVLVARLGECDSERSFQLKDKHYPKPSSKVIAEQVRAYYVTLLCPYTQDIPRFLEQNNLLPATIQELLAFCAENSWVPGTGNTALAYGSVRKESFGRRDCFVVPCVSMPVDPSKPLLRVVGENCFLWGDRYTGFVGLLVKKKE